MQSSTQKEAMELLDRITDSFEMDYAMETLRSCAARCSKPEGKLLFLNARLAGSSRVDTQNIASAL